MSFVAIDWGSSRFRAYRVEPGGVTDRITSARGIRSASATPAGLAATLLEELAPCGLRDAGYQRLPIDLDAIASPAAAVEVETALATRVTLRPGLALLDGDACDVLRGEEVQLLGAHHLRPAGLYAFPGTHCKWIPVERASGRAVVRTFSTMMTGELHAWLVEDSLVCRGIPEAPAWSDDAFARGVARAAGAGDVIEEVFRTRARWLLGNLAPEAAPSFLSGLLIGHELVTMTERFAAGSADPIAIVGAERLAALYAAAARQLGVATSIVADEAAIIEGFGRMHDGA